MKVENLKETRTWLRRQFFLFSKFGIVGLIAASLDIFFFNFFLITMFTELPVIAKILSGVLSTLAAWLGNRYWTFSLTRRKQRFAEVFEYFLVAAGGLCIALACLWFSHYVLGLTSVLADNISGNVIGLILATLFRFWGNQMWVFSPARKHHS